MNAAKKIVRKLPPVPRMPDPEPFRLALIPRFVEGFPAQCPSVFCTPQQDQPWTTARHTGALLLCLTLALATGCAARATTSPDGSTTVEIDTRGGGSDSPRAVSVAPPGPAAAPYETGDATVNALLRQIELAARRFDWRGFRQGCADAQEYAKGRERASAPVAAPAAAPDKDTPAVAGVRERADEAFWQELER